MTDCPFETIAGGNLCSGPSPPRLHLFQKSLNLVGDISVYLTVLDVPVAE